jgi:hypothetical protein
LWNKNVKSTFQEERKDPYGQKERENKKNPTLGVMEVSAVLTLN